MPLLSDYAVIEDIFDINSHSPSDLADLRLQHLKEILLTEALVRNLRTKQWANLLMPGSLGNQNIHRRTIELLTKLKNQNRFIKVKAELEREPINSEEWCKEAIASHTSNPLDGIITTKATLGVIRSREEKKLITAIETLNSASWWQNRSPSARVSRTIAEYVKHLGLILKNANLLQFIDPHLDPENHKYSEFTKMLEICATREPKPKIEIHRVCYEGSGQSRKLRTSEWKGVFTDAWETYLRNIGLKIEVFIWDNFHDRYLITDIIGISLPNGFDTSERNSDLTTWCRLGRRELEDIQKEFDRNSTRHARRDNFVIPEN